MWRCCRSINNSAVQLITMNGQWRIRLSTCRKNIGRGWLCRQIPKGANPFCQINIYPQISRVKWRRQRERLRTGKLMDYSEHVFDSTVTAFHKFYLLYALRRLYYTKETVRCSPMRMVMFDHSFVRRIVLTGLIDRYIYRDYTFSVIMDTMWVCTFSLWKCHRIFISFYMVGCNA